MTIKPDPQLSEDFYFERAVAITLFVIAFVCFVGTIVITWWKREQLKSIKIVYLLILASNLFYLGSETMLLYFRCDKDAEGEMPWESFDKAYMVYALMFTIQKITYVLVSWVFAHRYWVISLTLLQALSGNKITFNERASRCIFFVVAVVIVVAILVDSTLYYFSLVLENDTLQKISDITFTFYGLSLTVSLCFLLVAIWRISRLLKQFEEVKLNEANVGWHAIFLALSAVLNILLGVSFFFDKDVPYISISYYASQPPNLLLMLWLISKMSNKGNRDANVTLYADDEGHF